MEGTPLERSMTRVGVVIPIRAFRGENLHRRRTDIFEYSGVLRDYVAISTFNRTQELLDSYKIGYVLYPANTPLDYFLSQSTDWACVFRDAQAVIYRRVNLRPN